MQSCSASMATYEANRDASLSVAYAQPAENNHFSGGNEDFELETYEEFLAVLELHVQRLHDKSHEHSEGGCGDGHSFENGTNSGSSVVSDCNGDDDGPNGTDHEDGAESSDSEDRCVQCARCVEQISMNGWTFQAVDFSQEDPQQFLQYNIQGARFYGCTFPQNITAESVRKRFVRMDQITIRSILILHLFLKSCSGVDIPLIMFLRKCRGAMVYENPPGLPFRPARNFMYTQEELEAHDADIYSFYLRDKSLNATLAQSIHDFSIQDALGDYMEGKTVGSLMWL